MRTALSVLALAAFLGGLLAAGFLALVYPEGLVGVALAALTLLTGSIAAAGLLALVRVCSHLGAIRKLLARQAASQERALATGDAELDAFLRGGGLRRPGRVRLPRLGRRRERSA